MSTTTTRNVLIMEFANLFGEKKSIRISDPKEDLTVATVESAMNLFNDLRVFNTISLEGKGSVKGAKTVQTVTSNFIISVE